MGSPDFPSLSATSFAASLVFVFGSAPSSMGSPGFSFGSTSPLSSFFSVCPLFSGSPSSASLFDPSSSACLSDPSSSACLSDPSSSACLSDPSSGGFSSSSLISWSPLALSSDSSPSKITSPGSTTSSSRFSFPSATGPVPAPSSPPPPPLLDASFAVYSNRRWVNTTPNDVNTIMIQWTSDCLSAWRARTLGREARPLAPIPGDIASRSSV